VAPRLYTARGTYGDAYTVACRLYTACLAHDVHLVHKVTAHDQYEPLIREIYSILPRLVLRVVGNKDTTPFPEIDSHPPGADLPGGEQVEVPGVEMTWFPPFTFAKVEKFGLTPKGYISYVPIGGGIRAHGMLFRFAPDEEIKRVLTMGTVDCPVVVLGTESHPLIQESDSVVNLVGQTSILEAQQIIKNSCKFIGQQGLPLFTALSQRVSSVAYVMERHEKVVREARIIGEWKGYCSEIVVL